MAFGPVSIGGSSYVLPPATKESLGGVKISNDFAIDIDGTLHFADDAIIDSYPVGSIYQTVSLASPASMFGGIWEEIAQERTLMGASDIHAAGSMAEAGLPNIIGSLTETKSDGGSSPFRGNKNAITSIGALEVTEIASNYAGYSSYSGSAYDISFNASRSNSIYGASTTVQPAAYYVHIWHRVA